MSTAVPIAWNTDAGQPHVMGRYNHLLATLNNPHEISRSCLTKKRAIDAPIKNGSLIASWIDSADWEQYALFLVNEHSGQEAYVYTHSWGDHAFHFRVLACGDDGSTEAMRIADELRESLPQVELPPDGTVAVDFYFWKGDSVGNRTRRLKVPKWHEIGSNYAAEARMALGDMMNLTADDVENNGRIILLHGPAGTGKTTAIRALADSWKEWCRVIYVIDPDEMFNRGGYLMEVLLGSSDDKRWRLIVIEDAEEFLTPNSNARVGQAVSRLFNLGDGMIGQGLNSLVLMTTNAPVVKLHEAIVRPGRCLANIEVPRLSPSEVTQWSNGAASGEHTLAELFKVQKHSQIKADQADFSVGTYL